MRRVSRELYNQNPKRYILVSGNTPGAPRCPFGNHYVWLGYDKNKQEFVRFTKSVFKELIKKKHMFKAIKNYLSNKGSKPSSAPESLCPNCWGRQSYEGKFLEALKTEGINSQNITEKKGWIQAYAEQNFTGIQLRSNDAQLMCNACKTVYK